MSLQPANLGRSLETPRSHEPASATQRITGMGNYALITAAARGLIRTRISHTGKTLFNVQDAVRVAEEARKMSES